MNTYIINIESLSQDSYAERLNPFSNSPRAMSNGYAFFAYIHVYYAFVRTTRFPCTVYPSAIDSDSLEPLKIII